MGFFSVSINVLVFVPLNQTIQKGIKKKVKITLCPTLCVQERERERFVLTKVDSDENSQI